jgi:hypothetical protein
MANPVVLAVLALALGACGGSSKSGTPGSAGHDGGAGSSAGGHGGTAAGASGSSGAGGQAGDMAMTGAAGDMMQTDGGSPSDGSPGDGPSDGKPGKCLPTLCQQPGGRYCGSFSDGCGGTAMCGDCPKGQTCGDGSPDGGIAHVCFDPNCKPIACSGPGYQFCGSIGDGCGKPLSCPDCMAPKTCGGGGTKNVCGP